MEPEQAQPFGLVYALNFRSAIVGLAHDDGQALLYLAQENPSDRRQKWPETLYQVGAGRSGVCMLGTLLHEQLEMPADVAVAVTVLFQPYILCLDPERRDLTALLVHDDAYVRSTTQCHLNPEDT
jgi:hypothetical protein